MIEVLFSSQRGYGFWLTSEVVFIDLLCTGKFK